MNNISKNFVNEDGTEEKVVASSSDDYKINLTSNYVLANKTQTKKESKFARKFKNSLIGADIGVKSKGFSSVAILATVIAIAALLVIYFIWRF